jgi:hypothetical protein
MSSKSEESLAAEPSSENSPSLAYLRSRFFSFLSILALEIASYCLRSVFSS